MNLSDIDFVKYGSPLKPLDEDELPRKKPCLLEEQTAKDKHGRRRFHGAFTGGFSAGYFNTVGSTSGWKPSSFKSSRSKKEEITIQKPENFMDEEDLGEFGIAPVILKTRENYLNDKKNSLSHNIIGEKNLGEFVVKNYLRPVRETIGIKLLKKMGWKPGQGIGPRVNKKDKKTNTKFREKIYGCNLPPGILENKDDSDSSLEWEDIKFAPTDLTSISYTFKFNLFGIGYEKLQKNSYDTLCENKCFKNEAINKKHSKMGHGFGVGVFEDEDEDIYSKDDTDQYDFFLPYESQNQEVVKTQHIVKEGIINGFTLELNKIKNKHYQLPNLPNNLSLYCKTKLVNLTESDKKHELKEKLDESDRGVKMNIFNIKLNSQAQNPEEAQNINSFTSTVFKEFLAASEPEDLSSPLTTVDKYSDQNKDCIRAAKLKMFGPLTRKIEEWAPSPLLSKRFNIPEPKNIYQNVIKKNTNIFPNTITSCNLSKATIEDVNKEKMKDSSFCSTIVLEKKMNVNTLKIDLFKEIFLGSEETTGSEKYCNSKEENSEEIIFEEKIINNERNTSPPRGIFEHINLKKKSGETSSEIFHSVNCRDNSDRVLGADEFKDLFYGPKIPNTITEKDEVNEETNKVFEDSVWTLKNLKAQHKKKHKKHKKSSHKTKHKHKSKKKK